ncbi:MAG TPA: NAD(P)/FAD-dependent oxidoreductase [Patescibacteria group bacterium]|jgi:pyruvate/2-oxoglutarate dehydrogenase complex dihydrolipoamide dehydrogenase (E3) component|nr:NAD(P)/FAD-dependent oxidoreductase [Patescibacteria group bacterium]
MSRHKYDYDLIVIGSGCGSLAAHIATKLGKRVAIIESDYMGGNCPNWGCIPSMALLHAAHIYDEAKNGQSLGIRSGALSYNYPSIKDWRDLVVARTGTTELEKAYTTEGVTVIGGEATFTTPHEITVGQSKYSAENFLITTGAHTIVPNINGLEEIGYITHKEAGLLTRPPKSLFVIGAGCIGTEFAELFSIFGTKVYLSDITPRILPKEDQEVSELMRDIFEQNRDMIILPNTKVLNVTKEGLAKRVHYQKGGEVLSVKVDEIMVAAGRSANVSIGLENAGIDYTPKGIAVNEFLQTNVKHIFAAGDVLGPPMLTHVSIYQSRLAVHNMFNKHKVAASYRAVPHVIYTSPEIASTGMSDDECVKRDLKVKRTISPISIISRANTNNVQDGFVKIITKPDGTLLGASIVSPCAGEMIQELTLAIQMNLKASDVAETMHAFPTWSEAIRAACAKASR